MVMTSGARVPNRGLVRGIGVGYESRFAYESTVISARGRGDTRYIQRKMDIFFKTVSPPRDTAIPLEHDYIFIYIIYRANCLYKENSI